MRRALDDERGALAWDGARGVHLAWRASARVRVRGGEQSGGGLAHELLDAPSLRARVDEGGAAAIEDFFGDALLLSDARRVARCLARLSVRSPATVSWTRYAATLGSGAPTAQLESDVWLTEYDAAAHAFEFQVNGDACGTHSLDDLLGGEL